MEINKTNSLKYTKDTSFAGKKDELTQKSEVEEQVSSYNDKSANAAITGMGKAMLSVNINKSCDNTESSQQAKETIVYDKEKTEQFYNGLDDYNKKKLNEIIEKNPESKKIADKYLNIIANSDYKKHYEIIGLVDLIKILSEHPEFDNLAEDMIQMKDEDQDKRFSSLSGIYNIIEFASESQDRNDFVNKLIYEKDGLNYKYDGNHIQWFCDDPNTKNCTPEELERIKILMTKSCMQGNYGNIEDRPLTLNNITDLNNYWHSEDNFNAFIDYIDSKKYNLKEIQIIMDLREKYPDKKDLIQNLLDMEYSDQYKSENPYADKRFSVYDLNDLVPLYVNYPHDEQVINELINQNTDKWDINSRDYSAYYINKLVTLMNESPGKREFVKEYIDKTYTSENGYVHNIYLDEWADFILKSDKNKKFADKILYRPQDSKSIKTVLKAYKKNPEYIESLADMTKKDDDGKDIPRFNIKEIASLINLKDKSLLNYEYLNGEDINILDNDVFLNSKHRTNEDVRTFIKYWGAEKTQYFENSYNKQPNCSMNWYNDTDCREVILNILNDNEVEPWKKRMLYERINVNTEDEFYNICKNKDIPLDCKSKIINAFNDYNAKNALALCNDKEFDFLPKKFIPSILSNIRDYDIEDFKKLKELSKEELDALPEAGFYICYNFFEFINKQNLYDLSKTEKRNLLKKILQNKAKITSTDMEPLDKFPLVPTNNETYVNTMKKLAQSLNISLESLSAEKVQEFNNNLNSLNSYLKTADLSDLSEINLTTTHKEFINQVNDILKVLPKEEQAKIQDLFGFKIIDDNLTGYPNDSDSIDLSSLTDTKSLETVNKLKDCVKEYTDNNFITVKDKPELNAVLKELSKSLPELFNQIDGSDTPVEMLKSLQKIVQNHEFDNLSDSDKKVLTVATLLHNTDKISGSTTESAFDAYFIAKKFNMSDKEAQKVYTIIENSDAVEKFMNTNRDKTLRVYNNGCFQVIGQDRRDKFDLIAFNLKEGNNFKLSQMLYSAKHEEGFTRYFDKILENRINEIKATDFILPQTSKETYMEKAEEQTVKRGDNEYKVKVVKSEDIKDFYAFIHTPDAGYTSKGTRAANFANFDAFKILNDDKVICTSYISNGKAGLATEYKNGFIFDVSNDKQYVGYGRDMWSLSRNIPDMLVEYYNNKSVINSRFNENATYVKELKNLDRTFISRELKSILYDNKNLSESEINSQYAKRLDKIKEALGDERTTFENLEKIDSEFADAYRTFLDRNHTNNDENALLRSNYRNEVLVTNPEISAIYTSNFDKIPEEYLQKAQEENLPIVIIKT